MRVLQVHNPRKLQLTRTVLEAQGLHALRPGLDNVLRFRMDGIDMSKVQGISFRMQSKSAGINERQLGGALTREHRQIEVEPGNLFAVRWSRAEAEALRRTPGVYPFTIEYDYQGERLALAEGQIEIEAEPTKDMK